MTNCIRLTFLILIFCTVVSAACQPQDLQIVRHHSPPTDGLHHSDNWQQACQGGMYWQAAISTPLFAESIYPAELRIQFDKPEFQTFLENLALSLCAPLHPYRATIQTSFRDSGDGLLHQTTTTADVVSGDEYAIQTGDTLCHRRNHQSYGYFDGVWQETQGIDTPVCENPAQIFILWLLQSPASLRSNIATVQQSMLNGTSATVYQMEFTVSTDSPRAPVSSTYHIIYYSMWFDNSTKQLLRIEGQSIPDLFGRFTIDFDHSIAPFEGMPPFSLSK